ncbi:MAG: hypothetical protein DRJ01_08855 [Bacteroidetes bacterium]|nr:MAG: hypothetical protein DRJ01_08855 [Bacteroidota bacterium]
MSKKENYINNELDKLLNEARKEHQKEIDNTNISDLELKAFLMRTSVIAGILLSQNHNFTISKTELKKLNHHELGAINNVIQLILDNQENMP